MRIELELMLKDALEFIENGWSDNGKSHLVNWLKSLKSRVQPQPKQEWSEEDKKTIDRIYNFIWKNRKGDTSEIYQQEKDANWLKSLKNRVQPHWKPTEEQLMALRDAIDNDELKLLYEQLKKL